MPGAALLFVPAARSPHKTAGPRVSDADRVAMLDAAVAGVADAGVWQDELDRAGQGEASYWVDTLERARAIVGTAPLGFVIGADQAVAFHRWRESARILDLASPVVLLRAPYETVDRLRRALLGTGAWTGPQADRLLASAADVGTVDVSSTEIRELLRVDRQGGRLGAMLAPGVLEFIRNRGLYEAGPTEPRA